MAGKLYIVPTPVGNLEDMTFRAVEVLRQVDLILAEDTRTTSVLLKHYGISKPTEAHHKFNEHARVRPVCEKLLSGKDIALVSDAGTPGISDPGFMLVPARSHSLRTRPGGLGTAAGQIRLRGIPAGKEGTADQTDRTGGRRTDHGLL